MRGLRKFLAHHRLSETQFAEWLGCDRSLVSRWVTGAAIPTPDKMRAIYRLTRGQVQPNDFYDLPRLRKQTPLDDDGIILGPPDPPQAREFLPLSMQPGKRG